MRTRLRPVLLSLAALVATVLPAAPALASSGQAWSVVPSPDKGVVSTANALHSVSCVPAS